MKGGYGSPPGHRPFFPRPIIARSANNGALVEYSRNREDNSKRERIIPS